MDKQFPTKLPVVSKNYWKTKIMKFQIESKMIVNDNLITETREAGCFLLISKLPGIHEGIMTQLEKEKIFFFPEEEGNLQSQPALLGH